MTIINKHNKPAFKIVICSGGTGGHLFPAKSLATFLNNNLQTKVLFITDKRAKNYLTDFDLNSRIKVKTILSLPISGKNLWVKFKALFFIILGFLQCMTFFIRYKPKAVVSFGGYIAISPLIAAIFLRIPIVLHEQNALLGRSNRLFARFAIKIATSFQNTIGLNKYTKKVVYTGLPIREEFSRAGEPSNLQLNKYTILILGGSQGARIFGEAIPLSFSLLPVEKQTSFTVYHQCRLELIEQVKELWNKTKVNVIIKPFFSDIAQVMQRSNVILTRSGASTVAEINSLGKTAVYVPYKFATDNHQYYNAMQMVESKAGLMIEEENLTGERLKELWLTLMDANIDFSNYANNAKAQYEKDATYNLGILVVNNLKIGT